MNNTLPTKIARNVSGVLALQKSDVLLASFPRSGNTWMRFILCNIISIEEWGATEISHSLVDATMPELGIDNLWKPWGHTAIPRFVKTHRRYLPFFHTQKTVFIVRDPRDVLVSFYQFEQAKRVPRFTGTLNEFVHHPRFGIEAWALHSRSWTRKSTVTIRFEDMKRDIVSTVDSMFRQLNIKNAPDKSIIQDAANNSKFQRLKKLEARNGHPKPDIFKESASFIRQGETKTWQNVLSIKDIGFIEETSRKYGVESLLD